MTAALLPNAKAQFIDSTGRPLAGGKVYFYIPNTSTFKNTFQDPAQTILNTNPVVLDANGQALIWGSGSYRQVVNDINGNLIWDQVTQDAYSSLAGNIVDQSFVAGVDFTPGVTTQLVLSTSPLTQANTWIFFDTSFHDDSQWSLNNTTIIFNSPIPIGVQKVTIKIGSTLALGTINDSSVQSGSKLYNRINDFHDVKDFGAIGNGIANDSSAFSTLVPAYFVSQSSGPYLISTNTTITADVTFIGGVITVPSGVTLTFNGSVIAPSEVIFQGAGTVIINRGIIDVAWFDGSAGNDKWDFCRRGINATSSKKVAFYDPSPSDSWYSSAGGWGNFWRLTAPLQFDTPQAALVVLTYAGFAPDNSSSIASAIYIGPGTSKADHFFFPLRIKVYGNSNHISYAVNIEGSGHTTIAYIEAHSVVAALRMAPQGTKQINDCKIGAIYCAYLYGRGVIIDATASASNTITDCEINFINCDGFVSGSAPDSLVYWAGTTTGVKIGKVTLRAIASVAGLVDATFATVLMTNTASSAPGSLNEIGSILNGSNPAAAKALVVQDSSSGAGPKIGGLMLLNGGTAAIQPSIDINYTTGAVIRGTPLGDQVRVGSTSVDTWLSDIKISNITDNGVATRIDGKIRRFITLANNTATSIPIPTYVTDPYRVSATVQQATGSLTAEFWARSAVTLSIAGIFNGANVGFLTGPLTGTTGTSGNLTFSAGANALYIENRVGLTYTIEVMIDIND